MICRYPVPISKFVNGKKYSYWVPCGHCAWCLRQKRNEWFIRMLEESKHHLFTRFVTLDYRDDDLPLKVDENSGEVIPVVSLSDIQNFHKKVRKKYEFRFFLASEYGPKHGRPHYHAIYWSDEKIDWSNLWTHGDVTADLPAKPESFKYVTKYILKGGFTPVGADPLFHTMSRRPGIGSEFCGKYNEHFPYYRYFGSKMKMPRYYDRKFIESLNPDLKAEISTEKLEYLSGIDKWNSLENDFQKNGKNYDSLEDYVNDLYKIDLFKQFKINKK